MDPFKLVDPLYLAIRTLYSLLRGYYCFIMHSDIPNVASCLCALLHLLEIIDTDGFITLKSRHRKVTAFDEKEYIQCTLDIIHYSCDTLYRSVSPPSLISIYD